MLSVRVSAPTALAEERHDRLSADATVSDITVFFGASLAGAGTVLMFDMARENANNVMRMLRHAGVPEHGTIAVYDPLTVVSDAADAADAAERATPGHPADGVLWAALADRSREDARPSVTFFVFLILATLIAGTGRLLDQPILIIGAVVVGPEFAPIAAICCSIVHQRTGVLTSALTTLLGGFFISALVAWGSWAIAYAAGLITVTTATSGAQTEFIVSPDGWSFVIAVLAGIAGVLSLTSSKPSALVGVFISITTVPAVGAIGLTLAVGAWQEAAGAAAQLALDLGGLILAGTVSLAVQLRFSRRLGKRARPSR